MPAPKPALKYRLLPEVRELNPGNPVQWYLRCFPEQRNFFYSKEAVAERARYRAMPLAELPAENAGQYGGGPRAGGLGGPAGRLSTGRSSSASRPEGWTGAARAGAAADPGGGAAGAVPCRGGRAALRRRRPHRPRPCSRWPATWASTPRRPATGSGCRSRDLALDTLEEMVQQPGCPNLYWALTDLPVSAGGPAQGRAGRPRPVAAELRLVREDAPMTEAEVEDVGEPSVRRDGLRPRAGRPAAPEPAGRTAGRGIKDPDRIAGRLAARLVEAGGTALPILSCRPLQVILLDERRTYEVRRDERLKLLALAPWQIDVLAAGEESGRGADGLLRGSSCPTSTRSRRAGPAGAADGVAAAR